MNCDGARKKCPGKHVNLRVIFNDKNLWTIQEYEQTEMEFWPEPCPSTEDYESPLGSECDEACMKLKENMKEDFPELSVAHHGKEKHLDSSNVNAAIWVSETDPSFLRAALPSAIGAIYDEIGGSVQPRNPQYAPRRSRRWNKGIAPERSQARE